MTASLSATLPPISPTTAPPTATSAPTTAPTITPSPTPDFRIPIIIEEAQEIRIPRVSPDGQWLGYWIPIPGLPESENPIPNTALTFYRIADGERCVHEDIAGVIQYEIPSIYHFWLPDGRVAVVMDGEALIGRPCEDFVPGPAWLAEGRTAFSPSGTRRATTYYDGTQSMTELVDMTSGIILNRVEWINSGGQASCCIPGQWLDDDRFLMYSTVDKGSLLLNTDGSITNVMSDLFGMSGRDFVYGKSDPVTGNLHLLLTRSNRSLFLYHGESGEVETLSIAGVWVAGIDSTYTPGFSPDGVWLLALLEQTASSDPDESQRYIRPLDDPEADLRLLTHPVGHGNLDWSGAGDMLAFSDVETGRVEIITFPGGDFIERWGMTGYDLYMWSWLDDDHLLLFGDNWNFDDRSQVLVLAER